MTPKDKIKIEDHKRRVIWSTEQLLDFKFPPVKWIIPELISLGLTVLSGAPKLGKSWLMLDFATALSTGSNVLGKIEVEQIGVLYLSLEDPPRRLQNRLKKIGASSTDKCIFATLWPSGYQGIEELREYLECHQETKLIVIDTWGRFSKIQDTNDYKQTTDAAAELKKLADEFEIAIIIVHHNRKRFSSDFVNMTLGSVGLVAAADTAIVLSRGRGQRDAILSITGRDVVETEYVIDFDPGIMKWTLSGKKQEVQSSKERQEIYDLLNENPIGLTPTQISKKLNKNDSTVKTLLRKMLNDSSVLSNDGVYQVHKPVNSINPVNHNADKKWLHLVK